MHALVTAIATEIKTLDGPIPSDASADRDTVAALEPLDLFFVQVVAGREELADHRLALQSLGADTDEPNVFYDPLLFMPALEAFGAGEQFAFVLVYGQPPIRAKLPPVLCGFIPLVRKRRYRGLPATCLSLWKHRHCFLCTPAVRRGHGAPVIAAWLDWLASESRAALIELGTVAGDGPFQRALVAELKRRDRPVMTLDCHVRALLAPATPADQYIETALAWKRRRDLRRQRKQLAKLGRVESAAWSPNHPIDGWINDFLTLEAAGWKGSAQSALRCDPQNRRFFERIAHDAAACGRLQMLALRLDDRPIALKCNLLAPPGSFAFKIAFDESLRRYSPGVLLELENIQQFARLRGIDWMDSCADPDHPMIDRLWTERRVIQTMVFGTGGRWGDCCAAALPMLRWAKRLLKPKLSRDGGCQ